MVVVVVVVCVCWLSPGKVCHTTVVLVLQIRKPIFTNVDDVSIDTDFLVVTLAQVDTVDCQTKKAGAYR